MTNQAGVMPDRTDDEAGRIAFARSEPSHIAATLRAHAYHLMDAHPIAASHLVLAAASVAPTCAEEEEVADHFSYLIADIAQQLAIIHRRSGSRHTSQGREKNNGAR